jgi:hypothetical protein
MRDLWARLRTLEAGIPLVNHHTAVVEISWGVTSGDYLAARPCPCGAGAGCGRKTFGVIVPQRLSKDAWAAQAASYYGRPGE